GVGLAVQLPDQAPRLAVVLEVEPLAIVGEQTQRGPIRGLVRTGPPAVLLLAEGAAVPRARFRLQPEPVGLRLGLAGRPGLRRGRGARHDRGRTTTRWHAAARRAAAGPAAPARRRSAGRAPTGRGSAPARGPGASGRGTSCPSCWPGTAGPPRRRTPGPSGPGRRAARGRRTSSTAPASRRR